MKTVITLLLLCGLSFAQLPDAPVPQPAAKCGKFACWSSVSMASNSEVLKSKTFWMVFGSDLLLSSFDAEMTHEGLAHHKCVEGHANPPYPSRWQLYRYNIPENVAVGLTAFMWTKMHGTKYAHIGFLTRPAYVHLKGGFGWAEDCW